MRALKIKLGPAGASGRIAREMVERVERKVEKLTG